MPKKETRYTEDGRHVLRPGEYYRKDKGGYQFKLWNPSTRRFVSCSAKTLTELREKEKQIQKDVLDGVAAPRGKDTLDAYFTIWARNKRIKDNVLSNYKYMYRKFIQPELGGRKLKDLKYTTIKAFYLELLDGERLAVNTLEVVHNVLRQILEQAVRDDVIRRNPADGILPEIKQRYPAGKKRKALTMDEQARFIEILDTAEGKPWKPAFMVLLRTGLRVGELTGLTWEDVDEQGGLLHVRRTLVYYKDDTAGECRFMINSTKTVTSARDLPLTDELRELFKLQKEQSAPCRQTVDGVTGFVFVNRFGDVQHQGTLNRALRRLIKLANADPEATPLPSFSCHTLRHTYCTNLIAAGVELTAASALMGHRDITTTANIYNDVQREQMEAAVRQMERYVGGSGEKKPGEKRVKTREKKVEGQ